MEQERKWGIEKQFDEFDQLTIDFITSITIDYYFITNHISCTEKLSKIAPLLESAVFSIYQRETMVGAIQ